MRVTMEEREFVKGYDAGPVWASCLGQNQGKGYGIAVLLLQRSIRCRQ